MYGHSSIGEIRGSPQRVLEAIDEYGRTKKYLMNVGNDKGKIVANLIAETKPQVMVELGGYVGYGCYFGCKYDGQDQNRDPDCQAGILAYCSEMP